MASEPKSPQFLPPAREPDMSQLLSTATFCRCNMHNASIALSESLPIQSCEATLSTAGEHLPRAISHRRTLI